MTENNVNIPLLRKAVEWAEAEAAKPWELCEWTQNFHQAAPGYVKPSDPELREGWAEHDEQRKADSCGTCYCIAGYIAFEQLGTLSPYGSDAEGVARDALGISRELSSALFRWDNTIQDVRRIAESIAGERL